MPGSPMSSREESPISPLPPLDCSNALQGAGESEPPFFERPPALAGGFLETSESDISLTYQIGDFREVYPHRPGLPRSRPINIYRGGGVLPSMEPQPMRIYLRLCITVLCYTVFWANLYPYCIDDHPRRPTPILGM